MKVFRTGLLDSAEACDIGVPAVPFRRLHAEPAAAALERAGGRIVMSTPIRRSPPTAGLSSTAGQITPTPSSSPSHTSRHRSRPPGALDADALEALGTSPIVNLHIHYDRKVLNDPVAAAIDSPVQWIFDRTSASGARTGQLVAVSLSNAVDEIGVSVADLRARYLPALERLLPAARGAEVIDFAVTHEPRATFRARPCPGSSGPDRARRSGHVLAGTWTDTGWPTTMEGAVRSGLDAAPQPSQVERG